MRELYHYKRELARVLQAVAKEERLLEAFLEDVLTPSEYQEIATRWQIVKQLYQGVPQRKIAKQLGVGVGTITRGSRELLDEKGGFTKVLELCKRNPKLCRV